MSQTIISNAPDAGASAWSLYNSEVDEDREEIAISSSLLGEFSSGLVDNKLLLGVDFSRLSEAAIMYFDGPVGTVDLLNPGPWPTFTRPTGMAMTDGDNVYRTYGTYAQVQSTIADRLHLLGGVRLARLEIDQYSPTYLRSDYTANTKLLPRVGAVFDITEQVSVFADYSEGMKGNPFVFYSGAAQPETSRQYEAGVKFDLEYGLSGSAAVFNIDRSRPDRHSSHPHHCGADIDEAHEVDSPAVIACCEATEVLHSTEASLDTIAVDVSDWVMWDDDLARSV